MKRIDEVIGTYNFREYHLSVQVVLLCSLKKKRDRERQRVRERNRGREREKERERERERNREREIGRASCRERVYLEV